MPLPYVKDNCEKLKAYGIIPRTTIIKISTKENRKKEQPKRNEKN